MQERFLRAPRALRAREDGGPQLPGDRHAVMEAAHWEQWLYLSQAGHSLWTMDQEMNRWWESSPEEIRRQEHSHLENWSHVDREQEAEKAISPWDSFCPQSAFSVPVIHTFSYSEPLPPKVPWLRLCPLPTQHGWDFSSSFQTIKDTVFFFFLDYIFRNFTCQVYSFLVSFVHHYLRYHFWKNIP